MRHSGSWCVPSWRVPQGRVKVWMNEWRGCVQAHLPHPCYAPAWVTPAGQQQRGAKAISIRTASCLGVAGGCRAVQFSCARGSAATLQDQQRSATQRSVKPGGSLGGAQRQAGRARAGRSRPGRTGLKARRRNRLLFGTTLAAGQDLAAAPPRLRQ